MSIFKFKSALQRCIDEDRDDSKLLSDLRVQRADVIAEMHRLKAIVEKIDTHIRTLHKKCVRTLLESETLSPLLRSDKARLPPMQKTPAKMAPAAPVRVRHCSICGCTDHIATNQKFHP